MSLKRSLDVDVSEEDEGGVFTQEFLPGPAKKVRKGVKKNVGASHVSNLIGMSQDGIPFWVSGSKPKKKKKKKKKGKDSSDKGGFKSLFLFCFSFFIYSVRLIFIFILIFILCESGLDFLTTQEINIALEDDEEFFERYISEAEARKEKQALESASQ